MSNIQLIKKVIVYSKVFFMLSFIGLVATLMISYPYAEHFSIKLQVMAHILTIVFAGIFKVTVVALMAAKKEMRIYYSFNNAEVL